MGFNIKASALPEIFEQYKGKKFCSLETDTKPELLKKGRISKQTVREKFGIDPDQIHKMSKFSAGIGYDYAKLVQNRLVKDGKEPTDYQAGTSWHIPFNGSTVIRQHKTTGDLYFYVSLIANNPPHAEYKAGDKVLDTEALKEFLPKEYEHTNQGLDEDRQVMVRTLKLSSVKKLIAENAEFIVQEGN